MAEVKLTIAQWRAVKEITQRQLGHEMGIHENTVRKYERHPENLTIAKAHKIADALGVSVDDIIFLPQESTKCRGQV